MTSGVATNDTSMRRSAGDAPFDRAAVEIMIDAENAALSQVMDLLARGVPFEQWRPDLTAALAGALHLRDGNRRELAKASRLSRHLFGAMPSPLDDVVPTFDRLADRLRADLPGLVACEAGMHLVDYDRVAEAWTRTAR